MLSISVSSVLNTGARTLLLERGDITVNGAKAHTQSLGKLRTRHGETMASEQLDQTQQTL